MVQFIMTNNLLHHKNYTELGETYQLVLPLCLEGLIPEDESVRLLSHKLEELDYTLLYQAYSAKGRNPAVDPKTKQTVFIDGTKLEACANKYTFVWKKSVGKWEEKMFFKMDEAVALLN